MDFEIWFVVNDSLLLDLSIKPVIYSKPLQEECYLYHLLELPVSH
jgi:hypothetical protein